MAIEDTILELGKIGNWIQAVGLIVIFWIIVSAVTMFYNWRRRKLLERINERLNGVEQKLDKLLRKK